MWSAGGSHLGVSRNQEVSVRGNEHIHAAAKNKMFDPCVNGAILGYQ